MAQASRGRSGAARPQPVPRPRPRPHPTPRPMRPTKVTMFPSDFQRSIFIFIRSFYED